MVDDVPNTAARRTSRPRVITETKFEARNAPKPTLFQPAPPVTPEVISIDELTKSFTTTKVESPPDTEPVVFTATPGDASTKDASSASTESSTEATKATSVASSSSQQPEKEITRAKAESTTTAPRRSPVRGGSRTRTNAEQSEATPVPRSRARTRANLRRDEEAAQTAPVAQVVPPSYNSRLPRNGRARTASLVAAESQEAPTRSRTGRKIPAPTVSRDAAVSNRSGASRGNSDTESKQRSNQARTNVNPRKSDINRASRPSLDNQKPESSRSHARNQRSTTEKTITTSSVQTTRQRSGSRFQDQISTTQKSRSRSRPHSFDEQKLEVLPLFESEAATVKIAPVKNTTPRRKSSSPDYDAITVTTSDPKYNSIRANYLQDATSWSSTRPTKKPTTTDFTQSTRGSYSTDSTSWSSTKTPKKLSTPDSTPSQSTRGSYSTDSWSSTKSPKKPTISDSTASQSTRGSYSTDSSFWSSTKSPKKPTTPDSTPSQSTRGSYSTDSASWGSTKATKKPTTPETVRTQNTRLFNRVETTTENGKKSVVKESIQVSRVKEVTTKRKVVRKKKMGSNDKAVRTESREQTSDTPPSTYEYKITPNWAEDFKTDGFDEFDNKVTTSPPGWRVSYSSIPDFTTHFNYDKWPEDGQNKASVSTQASSIKEKDRKLSTVTPERKPTDRQNRVLQDRVNNERRTTERVTENNKKSKSTSQAPYVKERERKLQTDSYERKGSDRQNRVLPDVTSDWRTNERYNRPASDSNNKSKTTTQIPPLKEKERKFSTEAPEKKTTERQNVISEVTITDWRTPDLHIRNVETTTEKRENDHQARTTPAETPERRTSERQIRSTTELPENRGRVKVDYDRLKKTNIDAKERKGSDRRNNDKNTRKPNESNTRERSNNDRRNKPTIEPTERKQTTTRQQENFVSRQSTSTTTENPERRSSYRPSSTTTTTTTQAQSTRGSRQYESSTETAQNPKRESNRPSGVQRIKVDEPKVTVTQVVTSSRGNKKSEVNLNKVKKGATSEEDIDESDNYPEPFKALIQAKKSPTPNVKVT